jgi:hypothetical protein
LKNDNTNTLEEIIEGHGVHNQPGAAAVKSAKEIEEQFILIRKSDLPKPVQYQTPIGPRMKARTAIYSSKNPEMYVYRAMDFLAIALYAEQERDRQAERELNGKRTDAYALLHPKSAPLWDYNELNPADKHQIDVVVKLMTQVDDLKETK